MVRNLSYSSITYSNSSMNFLTLPISYDNKNTSITGSRRGILNGWLHKTSKRTYKKHPNVDCKILDRKSSSTLTFSQNSN